MRKLNVSLVVSLCILLLCFFSCVKKTDLKSDHSVLNGEVLSTPPTEISNNFFTQSSGKWDVKWIREIRSNSNGEYDTVTVSIPYIYPAIGTFNVNCQGNTYDTTIFVYNTFEYAKLRFFNNSNFQYKALTKQQQPVTYNLNCSLDPQVYTLNSPFSSDGSWSFSGQEMKLSWNFIEWYIDGIYPVSRILNGDIHLIDENSFYFEGIESSFHESPTTAINPPFRFKYLVVRSN